MATAEFAVALPAVVLVLVVALSAIRAGCRPVSMPPGLQHGRWPGATPRARLPLWRVGLLPRVRPWP